MSTNIETRILSLLQLELSQTPIQVERRAQFDKVALNELAASIKAVGRAEQAIIVRPLNGTSAKPTYEVVDGERRVLATEMAELGEIRAEIRDLTDEQVEQIQIVTGLQKEGLSELIEALGYEQLQKRGHSVEEIALKVSKSTRTVYARLQLLTLGPAERAAFHRGELTASTALLLSRIADPASRREACGKITKPQYGDGPLSYRQAAELIERDYMLRLKDAPFSTDDAQLLPKAGACAKCPKRTGNQPADMFDGIKSAADVCTDRACFKLKREAHTAQLIAKAKESSQRIITGAEAKQVVSHENDRSDHVSLAGGYVAIGDKPWADTKNRSYRQLLGKDEKPIVLKTPKGRVIEVLDKATAAKVLKDAGIKGYTPSTSSPARSSNTSATAQLQQQKNVKARVFRALFDKAPTKLDRKLIERRVLEEIEQGMCDLQSVCEALGWDDFDMDKTAKEIAKLTDADLYRLMHVMPYADQIESLYSSGAELFAAAKKAGVNVDAIRKAIKAEEKAAAAAKKAAKPAAKKKAARKPK